MKRRVQRLAGTVPVPERTVLRRPNQPVRLRRGRRHDKRIGSGTQRVLLTRAAPAGPPAKGKRSARQKQAEKKGCQKADDDKDHKVVVTVQHVELPRDLRHGGDGARSTAEMWLGKQRHSRGHLADVRRYGRRCASGRCGLLRSCRGSGLAVTRGSVPATRGRGIIRIDHYIVLGRGLARRSTRRRRYR